jgi:hypothetical protein
MDIHPPAGAVHSLRDYFVHLSMVVVGILIALSTGPGARSGSIIAADRCAEKSYRRAASSRGATARDADSVERDGFSPVIERSVG